ncbi:MAG: hypothetical protein ACYC8T_25695 [Myxococcaceae bacterium]
MRPASPLSLSLLLGLAGCGPSALPAPTISSIEPGEMVASEGAFVVVTLDAVLPFRASYGKGEASVDPALVVTFGGVPLGPNQYESEGRLSVPVPTLFSPGSYDVSVRLADGREALAVDGFTVNPGLWPDSYSLERIDNQRRNVPFGVVIRAQGPNAASFRGNVTLSVNRGQVSPRTSGLFSAGIRAETVIVSGVFSQSVILTVTDSEGHTGASNSFTVN